MDSKTSAELRRMLFNVFGNKIDLVSFFKLNYNKWRQLIKCGVLSVDEEAQSIRDGNAGASNYPKHCIENWAIWIDYPELTPFDKDMIKRLLRTKAEPGKTMRQSRMLDLEKIIHIASEELRQLKLDEMYDKIDNGLSDMQDLWVDEEITEDSGTRREEFNKI